MNFGFAPVSSCLKNASISRLNFETVVFISEAPVLPAPEADPATVPSRSGRVMCW